MMCARIDGRTTNRMRADTRIVHTRLQDWADWMAMPAPVPTPPVATIERAITRLPIMDRRVIETFYLHRGPLPRMCDALSMTPGQFCTILGNARDRITSYLSALE